MYSNNDYRYYLEHQLLTSGGYLSHHGVMGMKWGIRRYQSYDTVPRKSGESGKETGLAKKRNRLENKKASNSAKIKKVQEDLKKPRAAKDIAQQKKYEAKLRKVNSQRITKAAERAQMRGENVGALGEVKPRQQARYERLANKAQVRNDKLNAKIADLEYKNLRIDKKLANVDMKMKVNDLNKQRKKELSVINNSQIADDKSYRKEANKQINAYWDDRVREAKGKKTKSRNSGHGDYSKKYDRELIDLDLMTAEEYPRKNKNRR